MSLAARHRGFSVLHLSDGASADFVVGTIDCPGWYPNVTKTFVAVRVAFEKTVNLKGMSCDGVTAAQRFKASALVPLLCVRGVYEVASGDLGLSGKADTTSKINFAGPADQAERSILKKNVAP